jgi:hypothetical protein
MIFNTGASEQTYFLDLLSFESKGEDGTPVFTPENDSENVFLSWFRFPSYEILIPALSSAEVSFSVVVPDDVSAGSYSGAITVAPAPSDVVAGNGVIIEAKIAILVFLTVEGETHEKLELLDFTIDPLGLTLPFGTLHYRIQNQGNVFLTPMGTVKFVGLFGQEIATVDVNGSEGRILPSSTRTYDVVFSHDEMSWFHRAMYQLRHLMVGPVRAELTLNYGENGSVTAITTTQVVPAELIVVTAGSFMFAFLLSRKWSKT